MVAEEGNQHLEHRIPAPQGRPLEVMLLKGAESSDISRALEQEQEGTWRLALEGPLEDLAQALLGPSPPG